MYMRFLCHLLSLHAYAAVVCHIGHITDNPKSHRIFRIFHICEHHVDTDIVGMGVMSQDIILCDSFFTDSHDFKTESVKDEAKFDNKTGLTANPLGDGKVGVVGTSISFNRYFYRYERPRDPKAIAREIGTYEISIRPGHGCSIVPIHPVTEADPAKVAEMSATVDVDALARASADAARLDSGA